MSVGHGPGHDLRTTKTWDLETFLEDEMFTYAGLTLSLKELQSLFRYEKMRRAAVMKEMKRMANIVANRGGKKDPVFNKPVKTQGPRKTTLPNPEEISDLNPSTRRWKNLYY